MLWTWMGLPNVQALQEGVIYTLIIALALGLALTWALGTVLMRGRPGSVPPASPPARDLSLSDPNNVSLSATYWPGLNADAPGVLLLHGLHASRAHNVPNAIWLHGLGYAVLTPDFRGHGGSGRAKISFGLREAEDAALAFAWLKEQQGGAPVAVIGISMGGAAALLGEAGPLPAEALVLQAVYADLRRAIRNRIAASLGPLMASLLEPLLSYQSVPRFRTWPSSLSPRKALARFKGPVMVIGGTQDRYTPPDETRLLYDAAKGSGRMWLRPLGDHAEVCAADDVEYRDQVAEFLRETIGLPGERPS